MTQQTKPTNAGETARDALKAAETEHAAKLAGERDARAQLEVATQTLQDEGTAAARKALINAEQATRFAEIEARGSSQRVAQARERHEQADHADRLGAHARRAVGVSFMSFTAASREIAARRADLAARLAEVEVDAAKVCQGFAQEAASLAEQARELGAPATRALDYPRALDSFTARARGDGAVAILAQVWKASVPKGMGAEETLAAVERGVDPREVVNALAGLENAVAMQKAAAIKLVTIGHILKPAQSDTASFLTKFNGSTAALQACRAKLNALGFGAAAGNVHEDALAVRLLASDARKVGDLVAQLRSAAYAEIPGATNQHQTALGRARLAADLVAQLDALGFGNEGRALLPSTPSAAAAVSTSGGPGFVNLGGGG